MNALTLPSPAFVRAERLAYQQQDTRQTLDEALGEYYVANKGRVRPPAELDPDSAELFTSHDMCHVIFGLDTTLADETIADFRTVLGCDVGVLRYSRYLLTNKEAQQIFADLGYATAARSLIVNSPRILAAIAASFRQKKKWPWLPPAEFHGRTLGELRREFGIRVI